MREEELKYRVATKRELDALGDALGAPVRTERQRNHYIDTRVLALHSRGILVRVRVVEGAQRPILTVKIAERLEPGHIVCREEERELTPAESAALLSSPAEFLPECELALLGEIRADVPFDKLELIAHLSTVRRVFSVPCGELALDVVTLPGAVEFEIELETVDAAAARAYLEGLFGRVGVEAWREPEPKTGRLFRRLFRL